MATASVRSTRFLSVAAALAVIAGLTVEVSARQFGRYFNPPEPKSTNAKYDGRFALARIRYTVGPGGYYYRGVPAWAHGFPRAEENLLQILDAVTAIHPRLHDTVVVGLDDPELSFYPIAYMTEAGYWEMTDREAAGLRAYLLKGGFLIFDDFRPPPRGGGGWDQFAYNMARVFPQGRFVELSPSAPPFHVFFDIWSFSIIPQAYDAGRPVIAGLFEDNDPHKRLMAIANFNTDISDFWEFSGDGYMPVNEANEAYKIGVNYVMYGMTH
jgi:hypothetical protein